MRQFLIAIHFHYNNKNAALCSRKTNNITCAYFDEFDLGVFECCALQLYGRTLMRDNMYNFFYCCCCCCFCFPCSAGIALKRYRAVKKSENNFTYIREERARVCANGRWRVLFGFVASLNSIHNEAAIINQHYAWDTKYFYISGVMLVCSYHVLHHVPELYSIVDSMIKRSEIKYPPCNLPLVAMLYQEDIK